LSVFAAALLLFGASGFELLFELPFTVSLLPLEDVEPVFTFEAGAPFALAELFVFAAGVSAADAGLAPESSFGFSTTRRARLFSILASFMAI
ncbi:hypothetical protein OFN63_31560, partial [Escherichia coli]|nr:hypothetical protein [Escherichia coli]